MKKMVNGELVDLTPEEIQEVQQRQAAWEANEIPRTIESVLECVRNHICKVATERGYINCTNCASFQNSAIQSMKADADTFVLWRDLVWNYTMEQIDLYKLSQRNFDLIPNFLEELPIITWPEDNNEYYVLSVVDSDTQQEFSVYECACGNRAYYITDNDRMLCSCCMMTPEESEQAKETKQQIPEGE